MTIGILYQKPELKTLKLNNLGSLEQGEMVVEALFEQAKNLAEVLSDLSLKKNPSWFNSEYCVSTIIDFIAIQCNLRVLDLSENFLPSEVVAKILRTLNESMSIETLEELYLEKCFWSSESARSELARLLSLAPRLEICSIKFQQDGVLDRIKVERKAAQHWLISEGMAVEEVKVIDDDNQPKPSSLC